MSESRYNIVFEGQVVGGADPAVVKQNLAKVFKMDLEKVEKLFSGKPVVLKKDADKATAMKFRAVMKKAGAQCEMRAVNEAPEETPAPRRERASFAARDPETRPLSEEAAEQEKRRREEAARAEAEAAKGQSEDKQSAEPAGYPEVEEIEAAPPPESSTPEQEPAAPVSAAESRPAPERSDQGPPPDSELVGTIRMGGTGFSSEFDVAPPGADIGEEKHLENVVDPDISHLSMAPPGSDLEQLPSKEKVTVPDISHLKVVTPEEENREQGDS